MAESRNSFNLFCPSFVPVPVFLISVLCSVMALINELPMQPWKRFPRPGYLGISPMGPISERGGVEGQTWKCGGFHPPNQPTTGRDEGGRHTHTTTTATILSNNTSTMMYYSLNWLHFYNILILYFIVFSYRTLYFFFFVFYVVYSSRAFEIIFSPGRVQYWRV